MLESRHPAHPAGSYLVSYTGWRDTAALDPAAHYDTYGKVEAATDRNRQ